MEEVYTHPKLTPKQWVANVWYYYKWMILLGIVVITFLTICTVQFITKDEADISILVVGADPVSERVCEDIVSSSESFLSDLNGDGVVHVEINAITLRSDLKHLDQLERDQAQEDYRQYSDEILAGDACFLILDEYYYRELADNGNLVNLQGIFEEMPEAAFDYYGLRLGETPLYQLEGFSKLSPEMVLCLKRASVISNKNDMQRVEDDIVNEEVFRSFYLGKEQP